MRSGSAFQNTRRRIFPIFDQFGDKFETDFSIYNAYIWESKRRFDAGTSGT